MNAQLQEVLDRANKQVELKEIHLHFVYGHRMQKVFQPSAILTNGTQVPML